MQHAKLNDTPRGPLSGIRVVEIGSFIAGPFCGQLLADFGADVIKIEPPVSGDAMRNWGQVRASNGQSLWWSVIARNKRSLTLDLRRPEGQEILRTLLGNADVLLENFRPGTLEKWGLAPETLRQSNPELIVTRVSGFGQTGPNAAKGGFAALCEAMAGLRVLTGYADRAPTRVGISIGDSLAGMFATIGTLLAILERGTNGGHGQDVDVAISESVLGILESVLAEYGANGALRQRTGPTLPGIAPSNVYPTADGADVLIAANGDGLFRALASAMNRPELADDIRFATHKARGDHQALLDGMVADWTVTMPRDRIIEILDEHGVPAGPVNSAADVVSDAHFRQRGAVVEVSDPLNGEVTMQGVFPRLTKTPGTIRWTGADLGQHNAQILVQELGMSEGKLEQLRADGVI